jgi:putative ABC transport system permease protein
MWLTLKMAFRNTRRHLRRSLFTIVTIAAGLGIVIWMQCLFKGQRAQIVDQITSTYPGDVQIYKTGYFDNRTVGATFAFEPDSLRALVPAGAALTQRVHLSGVLSTGDNSTVVGLEGIDPVQEPKASRLATFLTSGEWLAAESDPQCNRKEALIGEKLAKKMNVGLGNKLVFVTQAQDGSLGNELFRVRGIFKSRNNTLDGEVMFVPVDCAKLVGSLAGVHEVVAQISAHELDDNVRAALQEKLGDGFEVKTWQDVVPRAVVILRTNRMMSITVAIMLYLLSTLGAVNTILMNVFERTKEFGIMLALGTTPGQVITLVFCESLILGVLAAAAGIALGAASVLYHMHFGFNTAYTTGSNGAMAGDFVLSDIIFPAFAWEAIAFSVVVSVFFTAAAGILPAVRVSRLAPVTVLRN